MDARTNDERRFFLGFFVPGIVALCASLFHGARAEGMQLFGELPQQQGTLQPGQRLEIPPMAKVVDPYAIDKKAMLEANRKELHEDVKRVLSLAQDLKDQIDKTDATQVVSVGFVQNAKEIEKLSKKLQKLARS